MASFDIQRMTSEILSEDKDAYDENLDNSVTYAHQKASEQLENLADLAQSDIERMFEKLEKIIKDLSKAF